jgi:hypothetical protein
MKNNIKSNLKKDESNANSFKNRLNVNVNSYFPSSIKIQNNTLDNYINSQHTNETINNQENQSKLLNNSPTPVKYNPLQSNLMYCYPGYPSSIFNESNLF